MLLPLKAGSLKRGKETIRWQQGKHRTQWLLNEHIYCIFKNLERLKAVNFKKKKTMKNLERLKYYLGHFFFNKSLNTRCSTWQPVKLLE